MPSSCNFFSTIPAIGSSACATGSRVGEAFSSPITCRHASGACRNRARRRQRRGLLQPWIEWPIFAAITAKRNISAGGNGRRGPSPKRVERDRFMVVDDMVPLRAAAVAVGLFLLTLVAPVQAQEAPAQPLRRTRPSCWCRIGRSTTCRSGKPAATRRLPASAAASSTISAAMPAKAIRWISAKSPSSIPAKARYRPAICARRLGRAPTPRASNSLRRISSIENLVDTVDGHAEHDATKTAVDLDKPEQKNLNLDSGVVFPTEHMVRAIEAARAGKTILNFPVYDGSETGDKVFNTLTVIGQQDRARRAQSRRRRGRTNQSSPMCRAGR